MDSEETPFGEGQILESEVGQSGGSLIPTNGEIGGVGSHIQRNLMGRGRAQPPHAHLNVAPTPGPMRHEIGAEAGVEIEQEVLVERALSKNLSIKRDLNQGDALGEQWG